MKLEIFIYYNLLMAIINRFYFGYFQYYSLKIILYKF